MNPSVRPLSFLRRLVLGLGALAATTAGFAEVGTWTTNGPTGVFVRALAIDPSTPGTLYAGGEGGVFKSDDAGGSWTPMNAGLTRLSVRALAIDPSAPATLYAGAEGGVFKSLDGGGNWSAVNVGLTNTFVSALTIDPSNPATLYAGTGGGVFKSVNGGAGWSAINKGFSNVNVSALAIDPKNPATLYAGIFVYFCEDFDSCLFKSTNGGDSWGAIHIDSPNPYPLSLAIDPVTPTTLYVGTSYSGVYKSRDGGGSWTAMNAGLPGNGLSALANVSALALDPSNPATLYAGTRVGAFQSRDGGGTWLNTGLPNITVSALAIDSSNPATLYAGTSFGVFDYQGFGGHCAPAPTILCLNHGRFQVQTQWTTRDGSTGPGQARAVTGDSGYFTFFDPANVEVMVKVLNGCSANGSFWTFAGGLTDVSVIMTVADWETGAVNTYTNAQGTPFQPIQDVHAFAACVSDTQEIASAPAGYARAPLVPPIVSESFDASAVPCIADATTLCLDDSRYKVQAQWFTPGGRTGAGQVIPLTEDTGAFWFFSSNNVEMVVKVLNGCGVNSRYWTFAGGLTNVDVTLTVTDTQTGDVKTYTNAQGTPFPPIQDTAAFSACP